MKQDARINAAMDYFLKDDQIATQPQPEIPSTAMNPRKRKASTPNGPRRSGRKTTTVDRPGFVSNILSDDYSSDRSPDAPLEQSIERDEEANQDCSLGRHRQEDTRTSRNVDTDMTDTSLSVRKAQKVPMHPTAKITKLPIPKAGKRKISSASNTRGSENTSSGLAEASTRGIPPPGLKVWTLKTPWKVPSTKAQSKPLGKNLPASASARTPPDRDEDGIAKGSLAFLGGDNSSTHLSYPLTPTNKTSRLPLSTPAAPAIPTPTSLPPPPASSTLRAPTATLQLHAPLKNFQIWVVTHSPTRTEERLRGINFAEMSLSSFLFSIAKLTSRPLDEICDMKLTLEMQSLITKDAVWRGQDEIWEEIKETFVERLNLRREGEKCKMVVEPSWENKNENDVKAANISEGEEGLYDA